ncbi:MAG: TetR/AcrR family transcriptional regulator C-terminal domain-containing protein [Actinomycetota bacterium]
MDEEPTATEPPAGAEVPDPPWRLPDRSHAAPRAPLTKDAITDAALQVLDRDGMDGLSMRRVGEELGTGAASLYWHVRNKEELLQLLFERITEEVELPAPDPSRWQEQLRELADQTRAVLHRHRDSARISLGRIPSGPTLALLTEWLFELLRPVGIPDRIIAFTGDLMGLYTGAFAFEESLGIASPTGEELPPEEIVRMLRDYVASLPEDRFPNTRGAADVLFSGDQDERYRFGVDLLIRGLETYAVTEPTPRSAARA